MINNAGLERICVVYRSLWELLYLCRADNPLGVLMIPKAK